MNLATGTGEGGHAQGDRLMRIENLTGTVHDDTLDGDDGKNALDGGNGNDYAEGGQGNDTVWAGSGDDTVYGNDGQDNIAGESGADDDRAFGTVLGASERSYVSELLEVRNRLAHNDAFTHDNAGRAADRAAHCPWDAAMFSSRLGGR